jgi:hypothetical protein
VLRRHLTRTLAPSPFEGSRRRVDFSLYDGVLRRRPLQGPGRLGRGHHLDGETLGALLNLRCSRLSGARVFSVLACARVVSAPTHVRSLQVLVTLSLATAALGLALIIIGRLKLASLVQYLPMPVYTYTPPPPHSTRPSPTLISAYCWFCSVFIISALMLSCNFNSALLIFASFFLFKW